jgi:DNA-cytosine methyltransferase
MSLGLIQGGFDVRVAVEKVAEGAAETYWYNLCGSDSKWIGRMPKQTKKNKFNLNEHNPQSFGNPVKALFVMPIEEVTAEMIRKEGEMGDEDVTYLAGGPPCQGFSTSNPKRCVEDPRSQLMWQFIRLTGELKPKAFVIENVPGLLSYKDFVYVLMESLENQGYVVRINVIDAVSYGVPQTRKRVFIQGARNDTGKIPCYPVPTHFSKESLEDTPSGLSCADVATHAFAVHGFAKEELKSLWWNLKLHILMNKKTAADVVERAMRMALIERVTGKKAEDMEWVRVNLRVQEERQKSLGDYLGGWAMSKEVVINVDRTLQS